MNHYTRHDQHHVVASKQNDHAPPQKVKLPLLSEHEQSSIGIDVPEKPFPKRGKLRNFFSGWFAWAGQRMTLLLMLSLLIVGERYFYLHERNTDMRSFPCWDQSLCFLL